MPRRLDPLRPCLLPLVIVLAASSGPPGLFAQQGAKLEDQGEAHWKKAAEGYRIALESQPPRPLSLREQPILKWTNPVRGAEDGAVFIWTDRGRPEAVASFYCYRMGGRRQDEHEFMSLASSPLGASADGGTVWEPESGVTMKLVPEAPKPGSSAGERMRQMRAIARDFKASYDNPPDHAEIRQLTQPLHRYELPEPRADLIDGAIFAFVHTTDPEVLLLLEARPEGKELRWHYGLARMSMVNMKVDYKNKEVWRVEWANDLKSPRKPYFTRHPPATEP